MVYFSMDGNFPFHFSHFYFSRNVSDTPHKTIIYFSLDKVKASLRRNVLHSDVFNVSCMIRVWISDYTAMCVCTCTCTYSVQHTHYTTIIIRNPFIMAVMMAVVMHSFCLFFFFLIYFSTRHAMPPTKV